MKYEVVETIGLDIRSSADELTQITGNLPPGSTFDSNGTARGEDRRLWLCLTNGGGRVLAEMPGGESTVVMK